MVHSLIMYVSVLLRTTYKGIEVVFGGDSCVCACVCVICVPRGVVGIVQGCVGDCIAAATVGA